MRILLILLLFFLLSCISESMLKDQNTRYETSIRNRASFEMNCDASNLKLTVIELFPSGLYKLVGVEGCKKKGVYVQIRAGEWVLNSSSN